jgi:hypothetical protein
VVKGILYKQNEKESRYSEKEVRMEQRSGASVVNRSQLL